MYWGVFNGSAKAQNLILLLGSYFFYAFWDWRFLILLVGISIVNFTLAIQIDKTDIEKRKTFFLYLGLVLGLGNLLFFKYYNFFTDSFSQLFQSFGFRLNSYVLKLVLPLGISFYTFRCISYLLDVYNEKVSPTKDVVIFCNYVSFFPTLVAGPIERAKPFITQSEKLRAFQYSQAADGLRQILWGLFKKLVISDGCAATTDIIFNNYGSYTGSTLLFGSFMYIIQVYADFSGYSDMAIGFSGLIGFKIKKNFNFPFFSQNIAEFWQKWHISLTSWMTDYVYTPLSFIFRRLKKAGTILAILINFVLVGLWHGANWTFIAFGFLQGCYFIPLILTGKLNQKKTIADGKLFPSLREGLNMLATFLVVMITSVLFRVNSLHEGVAYYKKMFSPSFFTFPHFMGMANAAITLVLIFFFIAAEWLERTNDFVMSNLNLKMNRPLRWAIYIIILSVIGLYSETNEMPFIYSKF